MSLLHTNQKAWNKKTVLFTHGIGFQPPKYSEPLYQILRSEDPATVDATRWREVAYDSVNDAMEKKVIQFNAAVRKSQDASSMKAVGTDFIVDLADYLFNVDPYNWINNIFRKELLELQQAAQADGVAAKDHELYIISHSLGTVVSYEALHSIVTDAQALGLSKNFKIKHYFTLGCPLAFIKANQKRLPSLNSKFFLYSAPISRPTKKNAFTGEIKSNVLDWTNIRQKFDPVASVVALDQASANGSLSRETLVFDAFNAGPNPHAFDGYVKQYKTLLMDTVRGTRAI